MTYEINNQDHDPSKWEGVKVRNFEAEVPRVSPYAIASELNTEMYEIGGRPSYQDFYNEFTFRLAAKLGLPEATQPRPIDRAIERINKEAGIPVRRLDKYDKGYLNALGACIEILKQEAGK